VLLVNDYIVPGGNLGTCVVNFCRSTISNCTTFLIPPPLTTGDYTTSSITSSDVSTGSDVTTGSITSGSITTGQPQTTGSTGLDDGNQTDSTSDVTSGDITTQELTTQELTTQDLTTQLFTTGYLTTGSYPVIYASVCLKDLNSTTYNSVADTSTVFYNANTSEVNVRFTNGLNGTSTVIHFVCALGQEKVNNISFFYNIAGEYHFRWATQAACPIKNNITGYIKSLSFFQSSMIAILVVGVIVTIAAIIAFLVLTYRKPRQKNVL